jgi:hypothetical protein
MPSLMMKRAPSSKLLPKTITVSSHPKATLSFPLVCVKRGLPLQKRDSSLASFMADIAITLTLAPESMAPGVW